MEYCSTASHEFAGSVHEPIEIFAKAFFLLCKLWILADKLMCRYWEEMEAELLDELVRTENQAKVWYRDRTLITPDTVLNVYRNTMDGSSLRSLVVDKLCFEFVRMGEKSPDLNDYSECMEEFSRDFWVVVVKRIIAGFRWNEY